MGSEMCIRDRSSTVDLSMKRRSRICMYASHTVSVVYESRTTKEDPRPFARVGFGVGFGFGFGSIGVGVGRPMDTTDSTDSTDSTDRPTRAIERRARAPSGWMDDDER